MWEETYYILPRPWRFFLVVLKVVAWLACWCWGKLFHHQVSIVRRHWWHSRSQILHGSSVILLTSTWVCRDLDGFTRSEGLPEGTCDFKPPEHAPRTSARAQTCVRGPGWLPACHGADSTRKDPRPEENIYAEGQNKTYFHTVQGSPSGCVRS